MACADLRPPALLLSLTSPNGDRKRLDLVPGDDHDTIVVADDQVAGGNHHPSTGNPLPPAAGEALVRAGRTRTSGEYREVDAVQRCHIAHHPVEDKALDPALLCSNREDKAPHGACRVACGVDHKD